MYNFYTDTILKWNTNFNLILTEVWDLKAFWMYFCSIILSSYALNDWKVDENYVY